MVITGAPVEKMAFEEVEYLQELCEIMEWSKTHVHSTFHICWGAQAGLYYHFGIEKQLLPEKPVSSMSQNGENPLWDMDFLLLARSDPTQSLPLLPPFSVFVSVFSPLRSVLYWKKRQDPTPAAQKGEKP